MNKKIYRKLISLGLIIALGGCVFSPVQEAEAAGLTGISDTLTRLKASSTVSDHTIKYRTPTGMSSGTIVIDFNTAGFSSGSVAFGDIDLFYGSDQAQVNGSCSSNCTNATLAGTAGSGSWGAAFATNTLTFTYPTSGGTPIATNDYVRIEIGTTASGGANQITNPSAGVDKIIYITAGADSGSLATSILTDDQVVVSATVDATFTFTISSATCALGTLSTSSVSSCSYDITTSTNAENGYATTIIEDGNLRDGSDDIDDVSDNTVTAGSEEYGIGLTGTDRSFITEQPITSAALTIASDNSGPISAQAVTVAHKASITATTLAGSYSHIVTLVSTGTF